VAFAYVKPRHKLCVLVKVNVGLIAPAQQGAGAELDLALIAGFLVILFAGPGSVSLDRMLGIEEGVGQAPAAPPRRVRGR
jgi:uncharacterized membrane protein YphA (DoxX/SURF4 family)